MTSLGWVAVMLVFVWGLLRRLERLEAKVRLLETKSEAQR
jgi:hypothetical protein